MFADWLLLLIASPNLEYVNADIISGAASLILCYMIFTIFDNISYFFKRLIK